MKRVFITSVLCCYFLLFVGCNEHDDNESLASGKLEQVGDELNGKIVSAPFQSAISVDGKLLIATSSGIMSFDLSTEEWSESGLENQEVLSIYKNFNDRIFAGIRSDYTDSQLTLFYSDDMGDSWVQVENTIFNDLDNYYENYVCFASHPDNPNLLFANLEGGSMVAVSKDNGISWNRMNYEEESYWGYASYINFMYSEPEYLYQGSENPLDDAWLAKYRIDPGDPVKLTNFEKVLDIEDWGNRRPNEIKSFSFVPDHLYIGQEGALSKYSASGYEYIYLVEDSEEMDQPEFPYSYISAIWVNPDNHKHLLFGGSVNAEIQPLSLYETTNEGETIFQFDTEIGLENPRVMEIIDTNGLPVILLTDLTSEKIKLVKYNYNGN